MGSLMAGWDSHVPDPRTVKLQRNSSLTKGVIEEYWRQKKNIEEEHLKAICDLPDDNQQMIIKEPKVKIQRSCSLPPTNSKIERSSSLPPTITEESFMDNIQTHETSLKDLIKQNGWWARTNSAFLNETPVLKALEGPTYKYASQFHVPKMAVSKPQAHTT